MTSYMGDLSFFTTKKERIDYVRGDSSDHKKYPTGDIELSLQEIERLKKLNKESFNRIFSKNKTTKETKVLFDCIFRAFISIIIGFLFIIMFINFPRVEHSTPNKIVFKKTRTVFYQLDIQNFEDTNEDGIGDYQGIINNLETLKNMMITHIVLCNPSLEIFISNKSQSHLQKLVYAAHDLGLKVLWDLTFNTINEKYKFYPTVIDGYYFSISKYSSVSSVKLSKDLIQKIHNAVESLNSTWYVEQSINDYLSLKMLDPNTYRHSTLMGVVFSIKIKKNFAILELSEKLYAYNYYLQQIRRLRERLRIMEAIYHFDSKEKDKNGVHLYTYFYALVSFSRFPIMLKMGQEFEEGFHNSKNYGDKILKTVKNFKKSYIDYFIHLNKATENIHLKCSTKSSMFGSMNESYTWAKRKVPHKEIYVYAFSAFDSQGKADFEKFKSKMTMIFDHNVPLEKYGNNNFTEFSVYYGFSLS